MAEWERKAIRARVRAGFEAARRRGIKLGRSPRALDLARARELLQSGHSVRAAARELGCRIEPYAERSNVKSERRPTERPTVWPMVVGQKPFSPRIALCCHYRAIGFTSRFCIPGRPCDAG